MRAVLQLRRFACQEAKVSLVHQSGALQGVILAFGLEVVVGDTMQFLVHQRHQNAKSFLVTLLPVLQKLSELTGRIFGHASLGCPRCGGQ